MLQSVHHPSLKCICLTLCFKRKHLGRVLVSTASCIMVFLNNILSFIKVAVLLGGVQYQRQKISVVGDGKE